MYLKCWQKCRKNVCTDSTVIGDHFWHPMASDLSGTSYEARAYDNMPQGIISYQAIPVKITTMYA